MRLESPFFIRYWKSETTRKASGKNLFVRTGRETFPNLKTGPHEDETDDTNSARIDDEKTAG